MENITAERIKFREKFGFGSFSAASNIVYQFKSLYYLFFLTEVLRIPMNVAGTILSLGIVWDAINDPLVGSFAVNHRFKNGERVRPFALYSAIPWAITVVLIFTNFHMSQTGTIIVAAIGYFAFELLYTATDIPYNCMAGVATNNDSDRCSINVHRSIGSCVGTGIGAVACFPLLNFFGALDENGNLIPEAGSRGFFLTACVMAVICIGGCLIHFFTTKERIVPEEAQEEHVSIFKAFRVLYSYRPFLLNTLYEFCYGAILLSLLTSLTYYCTYIIGSSDYATYLEAAYLIASLVATVFVSRVNDRIGRKKSMLIGGFFFVAGKIWFAFDPFSLPAIYLNCITTGIAVAFTFVMFNTNRNSLSDLVEWREGRRYDGMIGTADNLATKLGDALNAKLLTGALAAAGYDAALSVQPDSAVNVINAMLGWVPAIFGVLILVIVSFLDIDGELEKMRKSRSAGKIIEIYTSEK